VYLVGNPREMGRCLRQAAEMGLNLQFLSTSAFREDELLSIAGSAAEGVLFTDASYDTDTDYPAGQAFLHAFRAKYGRDPGMLAATGYDALRVVVTAILETDGTTDAIVQYLRNLEAFPGAAGPLTFDERGDVSRPVRISVVSEGRFVTKERLY
jgi:branched-chain amino acid transport system substrate-binding protein